MADLKTYPNRGAFQETRTPVTDHLGRHPDEDVDQVDSRLAAAGPEPRHSLVDQSERYAGHDGTPTDFEVTQNQSQPSIPISRGGACPRNHVTLGKEALGLGKRIEGTLAEWRRGRDGFSSPDAPARPTTTRLAAAQLSVVSV
jgi:hypothetical protein